MAPGALIVRRCAVMMWQPALAETRRLIFLRTGFLRGEVRMFFRLDDDVSPEHVIQMNEVASFFDNLQRGAEVRISDWPEHGSFGYWLPPNNPHHSIKVSGVEDGAGFFLALAKQVEFRLASRDEALNWPG
jgi:hypothetical protein